MIESQTIMLLKIFLAFALWSQVSAQWGGHQPHEPPSSKTLPTTEFSYRPDPPISTPCDISESSAYSLSSTSSLSRSEHHPSGPVTTSSLFASYTPSTLTTYDSTSKAKPRSSYDHSSHDTYKPLTKSFATTPCSSESSGYHTSILSPTSTTSTSFLPTSSSLSSPVCPTVSVTVYQTVYITTKVILTRSTTQTTLRTLTVTSTITLQTVTDSVIQTFLSTKSLPGSTRTLTTTLPP